MEPTQIPEAVTGTPQSYGTQIRHPSAQPDQGSAGQIHREPGALYRTAIRAGLAFYAAAGLLTGRRLGRTMRGFDPFGPGIDRMDELNDANERFATELRSKRKTTE